MSDLVKKARVKLSYLMASKGSTPARIEIEKIPSQWEDFTEKKGDRWVKVTLPPSENASSCIYEAKKGSTFPLHFHDVAEQCIILNEGGRARVHTKDRDEEISFPNGVYFKEKEVHLFKFLEDTKLLCIWKPKFKNGWDAGFVANKED